MESFAIIRDSSMAHHRVSWTDCQPLGPFDWLEVFFGSAREGLCRIAGEWLAVAWNIFSFSRRNRSPPFAVRAGAYRIGIVLGDSPRCYRSRHGHVLGVPLI